MTGLRPFTAFNCSLVARNSAGAGPPASDTPMTEPDGKREGGREGKKDREREKRGRVRERKARTLLLCCKECFHNFYFVLLFGSALLVIGCHMCDIRCL